MKAGKLIWLLTLVGLLSARAESQENSGSPGVFLRMGVGARALGLGGAYVGLAEGPAATYWNPSGLGRIQNLQFEFMNTNLPFDRTSNFFSGVIPIKNVATIGLSWIGLRVNNIEGRTGNTEDPDYTFTSSQNMIALSLGKSLASMVSIGGNVKFIKYDLGHQSATGVGFDAGLLIHPFDLITLGLMAQDIGTDYRWSGGFTEAVPTSYRAGLALKIYEGVVLAADVNKTGGLSPQLHFGGELRPAYFLPIRLGFHDNQISGGAGFLVPLAANSLEFNYSYTNDRIFNDAVHQISLVFSFGSPSSSRVNATAARPGPAPTPRPKFDAPDPPKPKTTYTVKKKSRSLLVTAALLNVRSGPGTKFRKIAQVRIKQKFGVIAEDGMWIKIKLKTGKFGWLNREYVRILN